jgi:hypothetical protein
MKNIFDLEIDGFASRLKAIRPLSAALVFVSAAERWFPVYQDFVSEFGWGDAHRFREVMDQLWEIASQGEGRNTRTMHKALIEAPLALAPDGEAFDNVRSTTAQDVCSLLEAAVHWTCGINPRHVHSLEFMFAPIRLAYLFGMTGEIDVSGSPDETALMSGLLIDGRFQRERTSLMASIEDISLPCEALRKTAEASSWRMNQLLAS